jgi:hypothetical protein
LKALSNLPCLGSRVKYPNLSMTICEFQSFWSLWTHESESGTIKARAPASEQQETSVHVVHESRMTWRDNAKPAFERQMDQM